MTVKTKPRTVCCHRIILIVCLLLMMSCDHTSKEQTVTTKATESDSMSIWISVGRDASKSSVIRKSNLLKAYEATTDHTSDSVKLKYLSKIQWSFLGLNDSLWFRRTNKETNLLAYKSADSMRIAGSHWDLGLFLSNRMIKDSAFYHLTEAQKIYGLRKDAKRNGLVLYEIGNLQADIKDYTGSEISLVKAIELLKPLEEYFWLYHCYNALGTVSKDLGDYQRAITHYENAAEYLEKAGTTKQAKNRLENNIGVNYHEMGQPEKAVSYFESALSADSLRLKSPIKYARTLNNLAKSKYLLSDNEQAESMFLESLKIRDSIQDLAGLAGGYFNLAEYYTHKKDTLKAIVSAKKSRQFALESNNNSRLLESLALLNSIDHQNASKHGQQYVRLNDSLQKEERNIRNKFARIRFETDEFIAENELLARQKQLWTGIAGSLLLLGLATLVIITQRNRNKILKFRQQQQASNEEIFNLLLAQKEKVEEGKKLEQKRVSEELHDGVLGRMLGTRMMLLGLNKRTDEKSIHERAKAISILQEVEGEVRSISHELSHAAYQKIHNFILSVEDLLKTIRASSKIIIEFNYADDLDYDALRGNIKINLYRMIQEIIQNAVKHAECSHIDLSFSEDSEFLRVVITDNGKGFVVKKGRKGIGMRNIKSRMKKLKGTWDIDSTPREGTIVTLVIPVVTADNTSNIRIEQEDLQEF